MLTYYMSKYLLKEKASAKAATIIVDGMEERHIREAAEVTEGFSGEFPRCCWVRGRRASAVRASASCNVWCSKGSRPLLLCHEQGASYRSWLSRGRLRHTAATLLCSLRS